MVVHTAGSSGKRAAQTDGQNMCVCVCVFASTTDGQRCRPLVLAGIEPSKVQFLSCYKTEIFLVYFVSLLNRSSKSD